MGKRRFARWPNQVGLALIKRYPVASYLIAGVGALAAGLSHHWLVPLIDETPPMRLMLVAVVTVSAWLGGIGPSLLAIVLGLIAIVAADDGRRVISGACSLASSDSDRWRF